MCNQTDHENALCCNRRSKSQPLAEFYSTIHVLGDHCSKEHLLAWLTHVLTPAAADIRNMLSLKVMSLNILYSLCQPPLQLFQKAFLHEILYILYLSYTDGYLVLRNILLHLETHGKIPLAVLQLSQIIFLRKLLHAVTCQQKEICYGKCAWFLVSFYLCLGSRTIASWYVGKLKSISTLPQWYCREVGHILPKLGA